jgi:hypothetical protein
MEIISDFRFWLLMSLRISEQKYEYYNFSISSLESPVASTINSFEMPNFFNDLAVSNLPSNIPSNITYF